MIYNLDFNSKVRCKFKLNSMHFNTKTVFIVIIMITFCIQVNCIKRHHRSSRSKQIHHQHHFMLSNIKDNNINDHNINFNNINDHSINDNNINDNRDKSFNIYKDMNVHNVYTKIKQINMKDNMKMMLSSSEVSSSTSTSSSEIINYFQDDKKLIESASQTSNCPSNCSCKWKSGKKTVECKSVQLNKIPNGIDDRTQVLDLEGNPITHLKDYQFKKLGLKDLQKIFFKRCSIVQIDNLAFDQMTNLIELDLSENQLNSVPSKALNQCQRLRKLHLSKNPIGTIVNQTFHQLIHLQTLDLSECKIKVIDEDAFHGLKNLKYLHLHSNLISHLSGLLVINLISIHELTLNNNPWNCDCKLRDLREWMTQYNIPLTSSPHCSSPERLSGQSWDQMDLDEFACQPNIVNIDASINVYEGENASLGCTVTSIPGSQVKWKSGERVIQNMSLMSFGRQFYIIKEGNFGQFERTSTLYIVNVLEKDAGSYTCIGTNKAGSIQANLTLFVQKQKAPDQPLVSGYSGEEVAGIVLGVLFIIVLIFIAICFVFLKSKNQFHDSMNMTSLSRTIGSGQPERKPVLSMVNNVNNYNGINTETQGNHIDGLMGTELNENKINKEFKGHEDEDVKCLDEDQIEDPRSGLTNSGYQSYHGSVNESEFLSESDNMTSVKRFNEDSLIRTNYSPNRIQRANNNESFELMRRRSDVTQELKRRFQQQQSFSAKDKDNLVVRFQKNPTIYNYNQTSTSLTSTSSIASSSPSMRLGQSMESLTNHRHYHGQSDNRFDVYHLDYLNEQQHRCGRCESCARFEPCERYEQQRFEQQKIRQQNGENYDYQGINHNNHGINHRLNNHIVNHNLQNDGNERGFNQHQLQQQQQQQQQHQQHNKGLRNVFSNGNSATGMNSGINSGMNGSGMTRNLQGFSYALRMSNATPTSTNANTTHTNVNGRINSMKGPLTGLLQPRRSGGSLAQLLAIDARDSPDEGLGDEREYETDIFE